MYVSGVNLDETSVRNSSNMVSSISVVPMSTDRRGIPNCVCVVGAGLLLAGRVPKQFGFFSVGLYVLYLVIALALLFSAAPEGDD